MARQNIDAIHLSQFTHKHLFKVSPVIMPGDPAKIYRSTALGSKTDNLVLQLHCSQTGQCLIQSSIYIRNIPLNILLMVTVLIILFSLHHRQCLQIPENSALHSFLQFKKLYYCSSVFGILIGQNILRKITPAANPVCTYKQIKNSLLYCYF